MLSINISFLVQSLCLAQLVLKVYSEHAENLLDEFVVGFQTIPTTHQLL